MSPPQFQRSPRHYCLHCRQQRDTSAPRWQDGFVTILRQYHDINIVPLNCKWWSVKEQRWGRGWGAGGAATQDVTSALDGLVYSRWWRGWLAAAAAAVIDCASLPAASHSSFIIDALLSSTQCSTRLITPKHGCCRQTPLTSTRQ